MKPIRQGDVLLVPVATIPGRLDRVPRDRGRLVLAYGEATGHAHIVEGDALLLTADIEELDELFLRVEAEAELVHGDLASLAGGDHDALAVPAGAYRVLRQKEYRPEAPPVNVAD